MARVEWSVLEPGQVENVIAMMLCREFPNAIQVKPGNGGDGGIDVMVPTDVADEYEVYQVKYFTASLTSGQKAQIIGSHTRVQEFFTRKGWRVRSWYLTVPKAPTLAELKWFESKVVAAGEFPCEWRGWAHVEGWAAHHPAIVDYYLHGGKGRLDASVAQLTEILRMTTALSSGGDAGTAVVPREIVDGLRSLRATLNEQDPFYRYDIAIRESPTPRESCDRQAVAFAEFGCDGQYVSFGVHPQFRWSLQARPIPISLRFDAADDYERQRLKELMSNGRPLDSPINAKVTMDLPGGLGMQGQSGQVLISAVDDGGGGGARREVKLWVVDEDGATLASTRGTTRQFPALAGSGESIRFEEQHGVFRIDVLFDSSEVPPEGLNTKVGGHSVIRLGTFDGKFPDEVLDGLTVLVAMRPPHRWAVRPARGQGVTAEIPVEGDMTDMRIAAEQWLKYVKALMVLQEVTPELLTLPADGVSVDDARRVVEAAALVSRGKLSAEWSAMTTSLPVGHPLMTDPGAGLDCAEPLEVPVGGRVIEIGYRTMRLATVQVRDGSPRAVDGGLVEVELEPAGDPSVEVGWSATGPSESPAATDH